VRKKENVSCWAGGELCGHHSGTGRARRGAGYSDRSDLGARSAERICAEWDDAGGGCRSCERTIRRSISGAVARRHGSCTWKGCCGCRRWARSRSTTGITFVRSRSIADVKNAYDFPGFVPAYIRPLFCDGAGPFRWAALSGDASDIERSRTIWCWNFFQRIADSDAVDCGSRASASSFRDCRHASAGWDMASGRGLGEAINELVKKGDDQSSDGDWTRSSGLRDRWRSPLSRDGEV
jgi:hypothetical protein